MTSDLLTRKSDLLLALQVLEQDRAEGTIDDDAYHAARRRVESEAAGVLAAIDAHAEPAPRAAMSPADGRRVGRRDWLIPSLIAAAVLVAIIVFLVEAVRPRVQGGTITGNAPPTTIIATPQPSPQLLAAERRVRLHPNSVDALVALGSAYLSAGQTRAADRAFQRAMALAPRRPEAATMHALLLASAFNQFDRALALLTRIESSSPTYARAWLVDGLLSARLTRLRSRAIVAYRRFLVLDPHAQVAPEVRKLLQRLEKSVPR